MTVSSSGVEWSQLIKPLLAASYGSTSKTDVVDLIKSIIKSKEEILHHEESYQNFYAAFCPLAADFVAANSCNVSPGSHGQSINAAKILLQYLINQVGEPPLQVSLASGQVPCSSSVDDDTKEPDLENKPNICDSDKEKSFTIQDKHFLFGIHALCRGAGMLPKLDKANLVSAMKSAKLPVHIRTSSSAERETSTKEGRRSRSDPSASILEQLLSPLHYVKVDKFVESTPKNKDEESNVAETSSNFNMSNLFGTHCIAALQGMGGGEILIDICLKLPTILKYTQRYKDLLEGKGHGFPTNSNDALALKSGFSQILVDLRTVWRILSLPILEPLGSTRLQKLTTILNAALLASLSVAVTIGVLTVASQISSSSKTPPLTREEDLELIASQITEKALDLFNLTLRAVRSSTRAGGHNVQNLQLMGAWLLLTSMHQLIPILSNVVVPTDKKEEKGRSPIRKDGSGSGRINWNRVQQGFSVVCVALASQGLTLLNGLLEDVKVEGWSPAKAPEAARLDTIEQFTATERLARVFNAIPLNQLLFYLALVSYRKSCSLKRTHRMLTEGDTFSISDSTSYYEDEFSEESLEEEDDDSVIIGSWFEEPSVSGEDPHEKPAASSDESSAPINQETKTQTGLNMSSVPEKGQPHGFISLASRIFVLMNNHLIESDCAYVKQYVRAGLGETHMVILAAIIRDLDKETARGDSGNSTTNLDGSLSCLYEDFSLSLYRYTHNIIASCFLNETLQAALLVQLGVSPWTPDADWPLQVLPRTLSVLAQVLLLRQRKESDQLRCDSDVACVQIWQRVIKTLTKSIINPPIQDSEIEDMNVEHAQLLLFLFHSLQLMQKKNVLLNVASALVTVSPIVSTPMKDFQILHLSRILVIFDYLMKNLYEAPQVLIDQIKSNLFHKISVETSDETKDTSNSSKAYLFYTLEEDYSKHASPEDSVRTPCFYTLTPCEWNFQETPKLDGLACSFVLATPDILNYNTFYDALLNLLNIGCQLDGSARKPENSLSFLGLCGVEYAFALAFRTFLIMPPSVASLEALANLESNYDGPLVLHPSIWGPRATNKTFTSWIKDGLVRQSLTTQKADSMLKTVSTATCSLQYQMKLVTQLVNSIVKKDATRTSNASLHDMPDFSKIFLLDAILTSLTVSINETCSLWDIDANAPETSESFVSLKIGPDQVPTTSILSLMTFITNVSRLCLGQQISVLSKEKTSDKTIEACAHMLAISGNKFPVLQGCLKKESLPSTLQSVLDIWNSKGTQNFTSPSIWKPNYANEFNVAENRMCAVAMGHFACLSAEASFTMHSSLQHMLQTLVKFVTDAVRWYPDTDKVYSQIVSTLVSLCVDASCQHIDASLKTALNCSINWTGDAQDSELTPKVKGYMNQCILDHIYKLFVLAVEDDSVVSENVLEDCGAFMEKLLESPVGQKSLKTFFDDVDFSTTILQSLSNTFSKVGYVVPMGKCSLLNVVLKFLMKMLQNAEKNSEDETLLAIFHRLSLASWIEKSVAEDWFVSSLLCDPSDFDDHLDCWGLLHSLATLSTAIGSPLISTKSFASSLLTLGDRMIERSCDNFTSLGHLLKLMNSLLSTATAEEHVLMFKSVSRWTAKCKDLLNGENDQRILDLLSQLLPYISDIIVALKLQMPGKSTGATEVNSSPYDDITEDSDWMEDLSPEDEESAAEDSDEENLCNMLCTYTITRKDFMNQHWYHCHTCKMVDGVGVCTICAKVCHKGHDITYAKFGSFFCDCGDKDDVTCQALVKRNQSSAVDSTSGPNNTSSFGVESLIHSYMNKQAPSPLHATQIDKGGEDSQKQRQSLSKVLDACKDKLLVEVNNSGIGATILALLQTLVPTIKSLCLENSSIGSYQRVMEALKKLHTSSKTINSVENLMVPVIASQDGLFDNLRLSYSGEQGQTIRQLVSSHSIHRVAMCYLSSPGSRRQQLAVSHDKGKTSIINLSNLLKQYDGVKKKISVSKLSTPSVPFVVISISSNPNNDDFLALCGLKECHILSLSPGGQLDEHHVLHPHITTGNYIIRALWLPGQQTQLALITAEFVKIYDLATDFLCPMYFLQMPAGKIRDACFIVQDDEYHIIIMADTGYMFNHVLCEESLAKHGPFYITDILAVSHPSLGDQGNTIGGGGVSVYYSHTLQLLCFSYTDGKSFLAPIKPLKNREKLEDLSLIPVRQGPLINGGSCENSSTTKPSNPPSLCRWAEVAGHPGLITCLAQQSGDSNNKTLSPVILMVNDGDINVQELKVSPGKTRVTDMVAVRHSYDSSGEMKCVVLVLCDDGSVRLFQANPKTTSFWLAPQMQEASFMSSLYPVKRKKAPKPGRSYGTVTFPVDFFEHCSPMNDIEYGGNDLLQVYNVEQLKHRLNGQGTYIASTKSGGFQLEATNNDPNLVVCGIRIGVGATYNQRSPSFVEVFGRSIATVTNKRRFFDIPFTRDESLRADKKITITFGPTSDPSGATVVDSVKLYSKTKKDFGWPEEIEPETNPLDDNANCDGSFIVSNPSNLPITATDMLVSAALEILDGCISVDSIKFRKPLAIDLTTKLLNLPLPASVLNHARSLLSSLHPTRASYHNHKDSEQLRNVKEGLNEFESINPKDLDCEAYHRFLIMVRTVAVLRPQNLIRFTLADSSKSNENLSTSETEISTKVTDDTDASSSPFLNQLISIFWKLHKARSRIIASPLCQPGLTHPEATVFCLIEVIHGYTIASPSYIPYAVNLYTEFLINPDQVISFSAKQALIRVLRPRTATRKTLSPQRETSAAPEIENIESSAQAIAPPSNQPAAAASYAADADFAVANVMEVIRQHRASGEAGAAAPENVGEALMGGMLDINADDDDAMVELAIALSLHDGDEEGDNEGDLALGQGLDGFVGLQLQGLSGQVLSSLFRSSAQQRQQVSQMANVLEDAEDDAEADDAGQEMEHFSDTTVSANASDDDEGSTAATDGGSNLMMASPAEHVGSGGSESGGSVVESLGGEHNVSTLCSVFGEGSQEQVSTSDMRQTQATDETNAEQESESSKLRTLRSTLLVGLIEKIPNVVTLSGLRSVPFFQVIFVLASNMNAVDKHDKMVLESLMKLLVEQLDLGSWDRINPAERTEDKESKFVVMKLLTVMMTRTKSPFRSCNEASTLSYIAADALVKASGSEHILSFLKALLSYWCNKEKESSAEISIGPNLLKPRNIAAPADMSPIFAKQFSKGHPRESFFNFPEQLTECLLRLPYQMRKLKDIEVGQDWISTLCDYTMVHQSTPVKRQIRKLLLYVCGSKENYRLVRDLHALDHHIEELKTLCADGGFAYPGSASYTTISLPYDSMIKLIEHLRACVEIGVSRTSNWQKYCLNDDAVIPFMIEVSCLLEEAVSQTVLQLIQSAICSPKSESIKSVESKHSSVESDETKCEDVPSLVSQINRYLDKSVLVRFVNTFLLQSNATSVRWQAHALILAIYQHSNLRDQEALLTIMWSLWPRLPQSGRKAAQFVDLLGYFSLKTPQNEQKVLEEMGKALTILQTQSHILAHHPNANLYNALSSLVEFDGYYLESEPCLVCNNPEVSFSTVKLSSIKVDTRYTTKTQVVKLVTSHMISRLNLRISDVKRTKMVHVLNIYYNNRNQGVVELKNKPSMWNKAKKVTLANGQTDVKVDFPLPIIACNLMFEYAEFYENLQASSETLQCPRCSAAVPASPGVCANCGENVYQCHKCRAINYDEKDPFLCNACGYCKYAKFEYSFLSRPCCAVDPIENEEDRQKAVLNIDVLLDKADRSYKQLQSCRPNLEKILVDIGEQSTESVEEVSKVTNAQVNRHILHLAKKYSGDCKGAFDELSKIIQKVQASRRELVAFDRQQKEGRNRVLLSPLEHPNSKSSQQLGRCYGCASATAEHCITLLRALAINPILRRGLCQLGLIQNLIEYNLRRGSIQVRSEVRDLLCLLTKDDSLATQELNDLIVSRISTALSQVTSPDLASSVRHEMSLLSASARQEDTCWEQRLKCVMNVFLMAGGSNASPMVMEHITLPCLRMLLTVIQPNLLTKLKDKVITEVFSDTGESGTGTPRSLDSYCNSAKVGVDVGKWLAGDPDESFSEWRKKSSHKITPVSIDSMNKDEVRERYLMEKFASKWLLYSLNKRSELVLSDTVWLKRVLFNPSSRMARQASADLVAILCSRNPCRKREFLDLLTMFLPEIGQAGESAGEFVALYQKIISSKHWKHYLALKGVLPILADLIMVEIKHLSILEETTLNIDLSQGYALKVLTQLLTSFVDVNTIKKTYKSRLLRTVLTGYLSLRKLIVQRTKLIDDTQNKFLELLEDMTCGTEAETQEFMTVCVGTLGQYPAEDFRTPVFIFERLCSIIYPEENELGEFYITLDKDHQQEDFLQGRMVGNPYSSTETGLGPLMRDIKIKICQDCELVALLEEENSMELLVCNKIISLDLSVKEVYKKVWVPENSDNTPMRIVYRMRGLLGDATEEFVETLDKQKQDDVDNEKVYRMASVMRECKGLQVMLEYLQRITDLSHAKPLVSVLLKLFDLCTKLKVNREKLADPSFGAIPVLLHTLKQCLAAEPEVISGAPGGPTFTEQVLGTLEAILIEASTLQPHLYGELVEACCLEDIHLLLNYCATSSRTNIQVRERLMKVLPFLVYGNKEKIELLIGHFRPILEFDKFDDICGAEDHAKMEAFCVFCSGIERNHIGKQLQDMLIVTNVVNDSLEYIKKHIPRTKPFFGSGTEEWKEFTSRPSLKYILRILTGLATKHLGTQQAVKSCIPDIHKLEQISSDEHVGSLAENLLEALDDPAIVQLVKDTRRQTRQEKRQLAMKTRKKELEKLGLIANEKEQITSGSTLLKQMDELQEESGLICAICLEGYKCHPQKVLAIYTFTKKWTQNEYEKSKSKTANFSTVSHFNVVHVDCHVSAVRVSHPRDEWERAALHNANTRANGLLPLWGPQVPESAFASCLARYNQYLMECTGYRDVNYTSNLCDLKLLFLRFAQEKSFSDDSGGGGPQSNMNLVPYLLHMSLYILNTTRSYVTELTRIEQYLEDAKPIWVSSSFEIEGPFFMTVLALAVMPLSKWKEKRVEFLKRLLTTNHVRKVCGQFPVGGKVHDKSVQPWDTYKDAAIFWAIIDKIYNIMFKKVPVDGNWSINVTEYTRHNDQQLLESSSKILSTYQTDLIPCTSFSEFIDAVELLDEITQPEQWLSDVLQALP